MFQESIEHYRNMLDTEAMPNKKMVHEFREREVNKEIQPKMRFTASTQLERIIDAIQQNRNSVEDKKQHQSNKRNSISDIVMDTVKRNLLDNL